MATLAALRTRVRTRLEETTAAIWSDAELDECITGALEAYSWLFPQETITSIAVAAGNTTVGVPAGAVELRRVTLGDGTVVPRRRAPAGSPSGEELAWEAFAGDITFTQPLDGGTLTLWHTSARTLAELPASDDGLLVLSAVVQALEGRAVQDFKRGGPPAQATYDAVIQRARNAFERELRRRGRRVRSAVVAAG